MGYRERSLVRLSVSLMFFSQPRLLNIWISKIQTKKLPASPVASGEHVSKDYLLSV